ncbi:uncharacterized protein LOC129225085 [Uloborus diversus]|uniref:uncharacterized protein LOC129225085 n=1 Tax=Uloborus diversus TaxID=327109 RepID=UPI00240A6F80|nr:uncharacterized protein LOC129225085 [Uloborus diversus]
MSERESAFESQANYYHPATRKWVQGVFTLSKNNIQFVSDNKDNDQLHLHLPLNTISAIEKKLSSFIYPSIVVTVGSEKHWFSSFCNRDLTYNMLELFWRDKLFMLQFKSPSTPKVATTDLGKELLDSLYESECILIETANVLLDQSQQLDNTQEAVENLNDNLNTLEANLKSLDMVKTFVKIGSLKDSEHAQEFVQQIKRYKIMFSFSKTTDNKDWRKGILVISDDISLLNEDGLTEIQIALNELESLKVLTPWEMCITGNTAESKKTGFIMCPQLSRFLKHLSGNSKIKEKIICLDNNSNSNQDEPCCSKSCGSSESSKSPDLCSTDDKIKITPASESVQDGVLSEEDAQAIADSLNTVQRLAAEIKVEEQKQLEKLDLLINDMAKTELRLKTHEKKIKKL